jgi:hypothetical protein
MPDGDLHVAAGADLSHQQRDARNAILRWWRRRDARQVYRLECGAGTRKTELVTRLGRELPGVQFASFTVILLEAPR